MKTRARTQPVFFCAGSIVVVACVEQWDEASDIPLDEESDAVSTPAPPVEHGPEENPEKVSDRLAA